MTQLGAIDFVLEGGPGGTGLSRQHFNRTDLGTITSADAGAAAAAYRGLWFSVGTYMPDEVDIDCGSTATVVDSATGAPIGDVALSARPSPVTGSDAGKWSAGVGIRVIWKTATVHGRRIIRGSTMLVPLAASTFDVTGYILLANQTILKTACDTYLAAMATANLNHVAWHRPTKGTFVGGVAAPAVAALVNSEPAFLKSRRS